MEEIYDRGVNWGWLQNKTVLITGAYGMLASYLVYFLIYLNETNPEQHTQIIAVGRNHEKMYKCFGEYCSRYYFHETEMNICEEIKIDGAVDYIIHAASIASPQYYGTNPVGTILPNMLGTYYLLELARNKKSKGFLLFSTGDVYGKEAQNCSTITESDYGYIDLLNIRSCYSESKRMAEVMCKTWSVQHDVPAKIVRIFHTYGPTIDIKNDQRVFSEFVANIVNEQDIVLKSDGKSVRSFCYLADATDAFFRILKDGQSGEAYNMANNDCRVSISELADLLVDLFPKKGLKVKHELRKKDAVYLESPVKTIPVVSTEKLNQLGWKPLHDLSDGFERTIRRFLIN